MTDFDPMTQSNRDIMENTVYALLLPDNSIARKTRLPRSASPEERQNKLTWLATQAERMAEEARQLGVSSYSPTIVCSSERVTIDTDPWAPVAEEAE